MSESNQNTRAAGAALRSGDLTQLKDLARSIGAAGGSFSAASAADLGNKPAQLTHLTVRKAGNENNANQREITRDRPPPGHGHGR
jgi:hypothetical protein